MKRWRLLVCIGSIVISSGFQGVLSADPLYRPNKEFRTVNTDLYEVMVQKNGRTDVKFVSGEAVFDNATPQVRFKGEDQAEVLSVAGKRTAREAVNDKLGQGQGVMFGGKDVHWFIRAYPSKPFFTVQVVYINNTKKPVRVSELIPWSVGGDRDGCLNLGAGAAETVIVENGRLFRNFNDYAKVLQGESKSQWNLGAYNPVSGRSLIAGFLTNARAYTQFYMTRSEDAKDYAYDTFEASCVYDPPVEVAPGEELASEVLYLAICETNPLKGLGRFGKAMAVWNGVRNERPFMPHGWDPWSTHYYKNITEEAMLKNLEVVDRELKRYGWETFAIDAGWERGLADWEANPETFPHGMKFMADRIHEKGMKAGLWLDPFNVPKESEFAQAHPEWLAAPNVLGRMVMGTSKLILDPSHPDAYAYIQDLGKKICQEWGFDAIIEADFVYHLLLAETYHNPNLTKIEVQRLGMKALKEGMGEDSFLMTTTPQMVNGTIAEGLRIGRDCAPLWRTKNLQDSSWGCVDTLTNAIRRFYMTPHLYVADQDCAFFGHEAERTRWNVAGEPELSPAQSLAWMTGAALTGGVLKIGNPFCELSEGELGILRCLLPSVERPATPLDLFQMDSPRVWWLPMKEAAGQWDILGLFNWDEAAPATLHVPLESMERYSNRYYTVYDFWAGSYLGSVKGALDIEVPAGSVRLIGLRAMQDHPMLLATNRHFTQGALDHSAVAWDPDTLTLRGDFVAVANTAYRITLLMPEGYHAAEAEALGAPVSPEVTERVVLLPFNTQEGGPQHWRCRFAK